MSVPDYQVQAAQYLYALHQQPYLSQDDSQGVLELFSICTSRPLSNLAQEPARVAKWLNYYAELGTQNNLFPASELPTIESLAAQVGELGT